MKPVMVSVGRDDTYFALQLRSLAGASGGFRMSVADEDEVTGRFNTGPGRRFVIPGYARELVGRRLTIDAYVSSASSNVAEVEIALSRGASDPRRGEVFVKKVKLRGRKAAQFRFEIDFVDFETALERCNHAPV